MVTFDSYQQGVPAWVELVAGDQRAAAGFYADLFGWRIVENPVPDGVYLTTWLGDDVVAGIEARRDGVGEHPDSWTVYLAVDDVDAATARVEPAGGTVEVPPRDVADLGRWSEVRDPSGALVRFWQAGRRVGTGRANEPGTPIWNELVTSDADAAVPFYEQVLGITAERLDSGGGASYVQLLAGGAAFGGVTPPHRPDLPPQWNVYFDVDDVDASLARVEQLGGSTVAPAFDVPGVGRMAMVSDPAGATFWLMAVTAA
ncbi:MAG TPA: VOC family protein [Marmoricola sp.]|nr:VOC family protein [Marmoricola sp.]